LETGECGVVADEREESGEWTDFEARTAVLGNDGDLPLAEVEVLVAEDLSRDLETSDGASNRGGLLDRETSRRHHESDTELASAGGVGPPEQPLAEAKGREATFAKCANGEEVGRLPRSGSGKPINEVEKTEDDLTIPDFLDRNKHPRLEANYPLDGPAAQRSS
jgi:hypothetical protein